MARFVDLDEDGLEPRQHGGKPIWNGLPPHGPDLGETSVHEGKGLRNRTAHESVTDASNPNRNAMTQALGCYP